MTKRKQDLFKLCLDSKSGGSRIALGNQLFTSWLPELNLLW